MTWEILMFYWVGYFIVMSLLILIAVGIQYHIFVKMESLETYYKAVAIIVTSKLGSKPLFQRTFETHNGKKFKLKELGEE